MKKVYLLILVLFLLFVAGCGKSNDDKLDYADDVEDNVDDGTNDRESEDSGLNDDLTENTIEITSNGFSPKELTINQGDTVTWINKDTNEHWPASAMHPTHEVYPGSSITKCGTDEQDLIFDSCKGLKQDEEWSFTFDEKGTWNYHDHLVSGLYGKIIVN